MGCVGLFNPMSFDSTLHHFQFPFMIFICLVLGVVAFLKREIGKISGLFFIFFFIVYILVSYIN
jgi:cation:H+ antiporter